MLHRDYNDSASDFCGRPKIDRGAIPSDTGSWALSKEMYATVERDAHTGKSNP